MGPGGPEDELLLRAVSADLDGRDARVAELLNGPVDWATLFRLALRHGVSPLLARSIALSEAEAIPADIGDALREHAADNEQRTAVLVGALLELLDALDRWDIAAIAFKGPLLGVLAYGDPSLRRAGDVDLFLRLPDIPRCCQLLERRASGS
jgi:hypothetical protein